LKIYYGNNHGKIIGAIKEVNIAVTPIATPAIAPCTSPSRKAAAVP
jgi:hypothetical protein